MANMVFLWASKENEQKKLMILFLRTDQIFAKNKAAVPSKTLFTGYPKVGRELLPRGSWGPSPGSCARPP
jgi:hypothetical protein